METRRIDLNADLGEGFGPWAMGDDQAMLRTVTSANVACGGHAGDPDTMFRTVVSAVENGVAVGAHPGYVDRQGFGRREIPMALDAIARMVAAQVGSLVGVAALAGTAVRYVKAHGALANLAARDADVAHALVDAVGSTAPQLAVLAISGTAIEQAAVDAGVPVFSEVFADRGYQHDGQLVPRSEPAAMLHDVGEAVDRMLRFVETGLMPTVDGDEIPLEVHSICVHGDSPGAVAMAVALRDALTRADITLAPFAPTPAAAPEPSG